MIIESLFTFFNKVMFFSGYVASNTSFDKPLSEEEEKRFVTLAKKGDKEARDVLIRHNLRLVAHIVKKYSNIGEADDLISVGTIGLIKGINSYEDGKGTMLSTYVARCIENEILMLIRVNKKHKQTLSLNEPIGRDKDGNELTIKEIIPDTNQDVMEDANKSMVAKKLIKIIKNSLSDREFKIVCMRYGLNDTPALTQREIALKLGISRSYISRLETKAIEIIKSKISEEDLL